MAVESPEPRTFFPPSPLGGEGLGVRGPSPAEFTPLNPSSSPPRGEGDKAPSYYDVSMLKPPVWGWEIATYFFLGGVSAGAYLLARMAERFGGGREVTRVGAAVAVGAAVPCAPLLIKDLGDPKRFHHMLRVWKPQSPMNLGAWTLTAYTGTAFLALLREWLRGADESERPEWGRVADGLVVAVTDAAGVPLALLLAGYTGVLLSATATPAWAKNPWLGPLFSASAISTGAAAISLALEWRKDGRGREALEGIDTAAHLAEAAALTGYLAAAGRLAGPLTHGSQVGPFWGAVASLAVSEALKHLAPRGRWWSMAASVLGLAGSYALRWAFVHAGPPSANDPDAARWASRDRRSAGEMVEFRTAKDADHSSSSP